MPTRDPAAPLLGAAVLLVTALSGCGGAPSEPATPHDEPPPAASEADEAAATLDILSPDPASVLLDGKPIGRTPISRHAVAPGSHEVTFVDESRGNRTMVITVQAGEAATVKADAPPKRVKMTEPEPAETSE